MPHTRRAFLCSLGKGVAGSFALPHIITSKARARETNVDVLIVGSGFCGVALAQQLASGGTRVAVVESGESSPNIENQRQNRVVGSPKELAAQLSVATQRCVGGTSRLWNSTCPIPEPEDFKSYTHFSYGVDWPFGLAELAPYLVRSANWLKIGVPSRFHGSVRSNLSSPYSFNQSQQRALKTLSGLSDTFSASMGSAESGVHASLRVAPIALTMPSVYPNIELFINTCVSQILFTGSRADGVVVHDSTGAALRMNATHIVLACGGTQNARLLQLTEASGPNSPLKRHSDLLGRHLMDHPYQHIVGRPKKATMQIFKQHSWIHVYDRYLSQKRKGLGANVVRIGFLPPSTRSGFIGGTTESPLLIIDSMWELEPNYENSIRLSQDSEDTYGYPLPEVKSELSRLDEQGINESRQALAQLADDLCEEWTQQPMGLSAHHIMGTTPFTSPQRDGVLDINSGVIGTNNLWVLGSSAFPSGLGVNPTLIATALSFKLADHLMFSS